MQRIFTPFVRHHATMKWQAWDWAWIKDKFPRDTWVCVQDFSENLKLEVKLENQSKYYVTTSVTLYGIVGSFRIEDVKESYLSREQRKVLLESGEKHIHVTMAFVSDDLRHNQAFVQHVNRLALTYVSTAIMRRPPKVTYCRTDGAPTQFANATMFWWIGQQFQLTNTRMDWSIHCSCHGV